MELTGSIKHDAFVRRGSLRTVHERECDAALTGDEDCVPDKSATADKDNDAVVLENIVDELVGDCEEAAVERQNVRETGRKRLGSLISLNRGADEG